MNGMRVKLTFTFTAMGNCFPLVVTVTGLTKWEMSGKDFVHVEISQLCIGGGGSNRGTTSAEDAVLYGWIRDH